jgi:tRNA1Val (adenine37-N6)-methyltransferase
MGSFRFRQFEVVQDFSAMRVNTDAVLLGAWMGLPEPSADMADGEPFRLLDIGTGTGVIALMAGQRLAQAGLQGEIHAVEIDEGACNDAGRNFDTAPWEGEKFILHKHSLQEFSNSLPDKFHLVFTNPPYFVDSLKSTDEAKILARHTDTLSQREILFHCTKLVKPGGKLAVVLPVTEGEEFLRKVEFLMKNTPAGENCFVVRRICKVHTVERKPAKRLLMEFELCCAPVNAEPHIEQLVMMSGDSKTAQYAELVGQFYL